MNRKDWVLRVFILFLFTGIASASGSARRVAEASAVTIDRFEEVGERTALSAGIVFAEDLHGRFVIRDRHREVVTDILKPMGRSVELLLQPGTYRIYMAQEEERFLGTSELEVGDWVVLHLDDPRLAGRESTAIQEARPRARRSTPQPGSPFRSQSLAKRHRLEFRIGYWDSGSDQEYETRCSKLVETEVHDLLGAFSYAYWVREDLSVHTTFRGLVAEVRSTSGWSGGCENTVVVSSLILGIRQYPFAASSSPVRPYVTAGIGPYWGVESWSGFDHDGSATARTEASFGGHLGGGLDIQIGHYFIAGINAGYNLMADFPNPLAGEENYSGVEVGIGFGLLLGRGAR